MAEDEIQWMALAVGLKMGSFCLHGEVKTNCTMKELLVHHWPRRTNATEVTNLEGIDFDPDAIAKRLAIRDYTNMCELGIALCLWRRGLAEIVSPIHSDELAFLKEVGCP